MRRSIISVALLMAASGAVAEKFRVTGTIQASSCEVSVDGKDGLVKLLDVPVKSLSAATNTAQKTLFKVALKNCPADYSIYFDSGEISPEGRLLNAAGDQGARNVQLEMLNSREEAVNLAAERVLQNNGSPILSPSTDVSTYVFYIQYYSTGVASAGSVQSSVTFVVDSF